MSRIGDFGALCRNTPSYTWCNLFYRQLLDKPNLRDILQGSSANQQSAPVGIDPKCGILRVGSQGSLGNVANIVVCALSMVFVIGLILMTERRKAAVGRVELRNMLVLYFVTLPFQLITNGSLLEQGSTPLVVLTGIHAALVATLFWALLVNALVSTQVVEDGSMSAIVPFAIFSVAIFAGTLYICLDVALGITQTFGPSSNSSELRSIPLFVVTSVWPALTAFVYFSIMVYIILFILREGRPVLFYVLAAVVFVMSQLAWFLLGKAICTGANARVDGSFVATILETAAVGFLFLGWKSITEGVWDDDDGYY